MFYLSPFCSLVGVFVLWLVSLYLVKKECVVVVVS